ncbi:NAD-dependent protein deacetylase sirtuin-2, partial [Podila humilis]
DFKKCDLLIVLGTSLQVEPFNRLITLVPPKCPRILINRDRAGENMRGGFDFDDKWNHVVRRDALFQGSCDEVVRKFTQHLGWENELQAIYDAGHEEMKLAEEMERLALSNGDKDDKLLTISSTTTATTTTATATSSGTEKSYLSEASEEIKKKKDNDIGGGEKEEPTVKETLEKIKGEMDEVVGKTEKPSSSSSSSASDKSSSELVPVPTTSTTTTITTTVISITTTVNGDVVDNKSAVKKEAAIVASKP